jgi:FAD synthase
MLKTVNDQIVKSDAKLLQRSEEAAAESVKEITKTNKTISEMLAREKLKDKALEKATASQK